MLLFDSGIISPFSINYSKKNATNLDRPGINPTNILQRFSADRITPTTTDYYYPSCIKIVLYCHIIKSYNPFLSNYQVFSFDKYFIPETSKGALL